MRIVNKGDRAALWVQADMRNLHAISRFVRDWLGGHEAYRDRPDQGYLVELAVIEVCTNVIRHAIPPDLPNLLGVTLTRRGRTVEVVILDRGRLFDPTRAHPPNLDEPGEGGYGIHLIRTIMRRVRYQRRGTRWNTLRLTHDPGATGPRNAEIKPVDRRAANPRGG